METGGRTALPIFREVMLHVYECQLVGKCRRTYLDKRVVAAKSQWTRLDALSPAALMLAPKTCP